MAGIEPRLGAVNVPGWPDIVVVCHVDRRGRVGDPIKYLFGDMLAIVSGGGKCSCTIHVVAAVIGGRIRTKTVRLPEKGE